MVTATPSTKVVDGELDGVIPIGEKRRTDSHHQFHDGDDAQGHDVPAVPPQISHGQRRAEP